jgi:hypothetical protein
MVSPAGPSICSTYGGYSPGGRAVHFDHPYASPSSSWLVGDHLTACPPFYQHVCMASCLHVGLASYLSICLSSCLSVWIVLFWEPGSLCTPSLCAPPGWLSCKQAHEASQKACSTHQMVVYFAVCLSVHPCPSVPTRPPSRLSVRHVCLSVGTGGQAHHASGRAAIAFMDGASRPVARA